MRTEINNLFFGTFQGSLLSFWYFDNGKAIHQPIMLGWARWFPSGSVQVIDLVRKKLSKTVEKQVFFDNFNLGFLLKPQKICFFWGFCRW
jgi:hypothetical protein